MEGACVVLSALAETSTDWGSDIKVLSTYSVLLIAIHLLSIYYTVYSIYITQSPGYYHGFIYFFYNLIGYRYFQPLEPRMSDKR